MYFPNLGCFCRFLIFCVFIVNLTQSYTYSIGVHWILYLLHLGLIKYFLSLKEQTNRSYFLFLNALIISDYFFICKKCCIPGYIFILKVLMFNMCYVMLCYVIFNNFTKLKFKNGPSQKVLKCCL